MVQHLCGIRRPGRLAIRWLVRLNDRGSGKDHADRRAEGTGVESGFRRETCGVERAGWCALVDAGYGRLDCGIGIHHYLSVPAGEGGGYEHVADA